MAFVAHLSVAARRTATIGPQVQAVASSSRALFVFLAWSGKILTIEQFDNTRALWALQAVRTYRIASRQSRTYQSYDRDT